MDIHSKYHHWGKLELCDLQGHEGRRKLKACSETLEFFL